MHTNYYVVLGITQDANPSQIRRAYRRRSHQTRPGSDPEETRQFEELKAAFTTLNDPVERARYDKQLASSAESGAAPPAHQIDIIRDFESHKPSLAEIVATIERNYRGNGSRKSVRPSAMSIEMIISPEEARDGTSLAFAVPVFRPCSHCEGAGRAGGGVCEGCRGTGNEQQEARVDVIVPRDTADGTTIPVSLRHLGIRNLYLQVRIRVA